MNNKAVIYISTFSEGKKGKLELNHQVNICREYANKNNYEVAEVIEQFGGNKMADDRPELLHLLEHCSKKEVGHVIIAERDKIYTEFFRRLILHEYLKSQSIGMHIVLDPDVQEFLERVVYPDIMQVVKDLGVN